ncbi:MAG: hypothetical protein ACRDHZ_26320, partial [Ktedonobacteraceae bacterium]
MIKVLGLALYGPLAASHRVRLSQYTERLAKNGISLHVHSLLGDAYLHSRFSGGVPPLADILRSYLVRLGFLVDRDSFDVLLVHCELLPFLPGWVERMFLRTPYI